jgi:hypothetical protein
MRKVFMVLVVAVGLLAGSASALVTSTTQHGPASTSLDGQIAAADLISGQLGVEQPPLNGWHPANTLPADQLPAFTDDLGINPPGGSGLTGLLNDFPGPGVPAKTVDYTLGGAKNVASIQVLSGNNGLDGRVFSTTVVEYSTNNGGSFSLLGYFQSDPSGTINNGGPHGSTLVTIFDNASATLIAGATDIRFYLYAVDNTGGQMRDPFDGVNPFTAADDGLSAAFVSPLIFELDVVEVPEPASLALLALGGLFLRRRR